MKKTTRLLALVMALLMLGLTCLTACTREPDDTDEPSSSETVKPSDTQGSEEQGSDDQSSDTQNSGTEVEDDVKNYNIIFTLATIPPVLAALEAIDNGYETYAIIERGKTYNGIQYVDNKGTEDTSDDVTVERIENFHNAGFDPANNLSTGFTKAEFDAMVAKVKALKEAADAAGEEVYFNFYLQDGTALLGAGIAANAGLSLDEFHVYMMEDGTGAYAQLRKVYVTGKTVDATKDEVYTTYATKVAEAKAQFESIMSTNENAYVGNSVFYYNIGKAFALASLDNFTYYIQDEATVVDILESTGDVKTKLLTSFGVDGYDAEVDYTLNLKYQKISEGVAKLTPEEKEDYLTLMYGQYYEDTYSALTRTERAGETAPAQKLVYIGSRHGGYPKLASNAAYGIGGLVAGTDTVPATYAELDAKYKTALLFETEADYTAFLAVLNNAENYTTELADDLKAEVQVACFNTYIDYIFNLKLTYALYGEDYDLIMKGHPREVIGAYGEWGNRYKVGDYCYDKLLDTALLAFHASDSTGKYIGMVPYGTAAENLAYLGADIALTGLPSSTYNGYDTDVDVLSIFALTDEDISGTASQVAERFAAGNLTYTDKNGDEQDATFYNLGNIYKAVAAVYAANGDMLQCCRYGALYMDWLGATHAGATDIDAQGFAIIPDAE